MKSIKRKKEFDAKRLLKMVAWLEPSQSTMQIYADTVAQVQAMAPGLGLARTSAQRQGNIKRLTPLVELVLLRRIASRVEFDPSDADFIAFAERFKWEPAGLASELTAMMSERDEMAVPR
jgi:hypothetical protein